MTAFPLKSLYICEGGKSGKGLVENSKLPKSAQPVSVGERKRQERKKKMSRRRLQMRLVSIRGSMEIEEKILCELMTSVHRQTQEDGLLKEIPLCVGRIQNGQNRRCSLEVTANTVPCFLEFPTPWSQHLERTRQWMNHKDIMCEYSTFQTHKSFFFALYFKVWQWSVVAPKFRMDHYRRSNYF